MSIVEFLLKLRNCGVKLKVDGDSLRIQAPKGAVTEELKGEILKRKAEIIEFLKKAEIEARANKDLFYRFPVKKGMRYLLLILRNPCGFITNLQGKALYLT